jgi:hypothetical protein
MAKQIKYRRGTTTQHSVFTGVQGELTVDTIKNLVIVHDGVTPGGWPAANASAVAAQISVITANNATQSASLAALQSNAAIQANLLTTLQSNAASQQASINSFLLTSNATLINQQFVAVNANVAAANVTIESLVTANLIQAEDIDELRVSITAVNANVAAANVAISGIVVGTGFATVGQLTANITATNLAIANLAANITTTNLLAVSSNIVPLASNTYSLGTPVYNWQNLYLGGNITANRLSAPEIEGANNELNIYSDWVKDTGISIYSENNLESVTLTSNRIVAVVANVGPSQQEWIFEASGSLRFPDDTLQTTAWSGNVDNTGNFIFADDDVSLPPGNTMTLSTYQVAGNKESKLTLSTATKSTLYAGNNLELGVGYGTGFEQYWQFGADGSLTFPDATVQSTANIMLATFTMTNAAHWTESVSTIGAALNQLAARLYAIENP